MRLERARSVAVLALIAALAPVLEASSPADRETVVDAWSEVMQTPDLAQWRSSRASEPTTDSWLERWTQWWRARFGPEAGAGRSARTRNASRLAALTLMALAAWMVLRLTGGSSRDSPDTTGRTDPASTASRVAPGAHAPEAHWRRAHALAGAGRYRAAIGALLESAMSLTERRGLVARGDGTTHRDYIRATDGELRETLALLVDSFEPSRFGEKPSGPEQFARDASTLEPLLERASTELDRSGGER